MDVGTIGAMSLRVQVEKWPLAEPFRISGYTFEVVEVLVVQLESEGRTGRGEGVGVYYRQDTPASLLAQIESVRPTIEAGISRAALQKLLPPGGARNALDCALWDLEAQLRSSPVWQLAGLPQPKPLLTTFTCGAEPPQKMAATARAFPEARAIKLKLTGDPVDSDRVRAVREAMPDAWLGVDANQGFTRASLEKLLPVLVDARVSLIEQPFPVGKEEWVDGLDSPIPLAADESLQSTAELAAMVGRFDVVNIKLDKCGGMTEGLLITRRARELGLECMVGNMIGTSLAMAPAWLVGQFCKVVDLDGAALLRTDRESRVQYRDGYITAPDTLWGGGR